MQVRGINNQTPRRRQVLLWGVCCFLPHFCYFSCVLFGDKKKIIKFATRKGVVPISNPEYIKIYKLKKLCNALKLCLRRVVLRKSECVLLACIMIDEGWYELKVWL